MKCFINGFCVLVVKVKDELCVGDILDDNNVYISKFSDKASDWKVNNGVNCSVDVSVRLDINKL